MKLRHAAALALVGWYLMVPFGPSWQKVGGPYFTLDECKQAKMQFDAAEKFVPWTHMERNPITGGWDQVPGLGALSIGPRRGTCIGSESPFERFLKNGDKGALEPHLLMPQQNRTPPH
jgi:hypothetical protein